MGINSSAEWRQVFRADWAEAFRPYLADLARCVEANKRMARSVDEAVKISGQLLKRIAAERCSQSVMRMDV